MSLIVGNTTTLNPVSDDPRRDPNGLTYRVLVFEGTETLINAYIASLPADYGYTRDGSDRPLYRVSVTIPNPTDSEKNEEMAYSWEMPGSDDSKGSIEHPFVIGWPKKLQLQFRSAVSGEDELSFGTTFKSKITELARRTKDFFPENRSEYFEVLAMFDHVMNEHSVYVPQFVCRLNQTVGSRYSKQISDTNTGLVYTDQQLITEAANNFTPLPERYIYKIRNIPKRPNPTGVMLDTEYGGVDNYVWGWLKKNSTENQVAGGRIEIQTEWVLDLWSDLLYGVVV